MAASGPHTRSFDSTTVRTPESRPRIRLPPEPARVHLPSMPPHWTPTPPNIDYTPSAPPNTMSYDQSFPSLGTSQPQPHINIPRNSSMHVQPTLVQSQPSTSSFEDRMRGMILSNDSHLMSGANLGIPAWDQEPSQRAAKRPNQTQRRQQFDHIHGHFQTNQYTYEREPHVPPHLRGLRASSQALKAAPVPYNSSNNESFGQNQPYSRPLPRHKQLYNPSSTGPQSQSQNRYQPRKAVTSMEAQIGYLDLAAHLVVPKVQMEVEEYDEKEKLRKTLERTCRKAVFEYEKAKNSVQFGAETVELKCFGSMSTTFATKLSDMDLVLVSPLSKPDASAPESEIPRLVEKALLDAGYGVRLLTRTRVPIIRFCEKPTPELKDLLLKERAKFENERDITPSTPKKSAKKLRNANGDKSDPILSQSRPSNSPELNVEPVQPVQTNPLKERSPLTNASIGVKQHNGGLEAVKGIDDNKAKTHIPIEIERTDPTLLSKSDEERIRLYRLAIQEGWYEPAERNIIANFMQTIGKQDATEDEKSKARNLLGDLPNVIGRYRPPPEAHPLEFPKSGVGIQCDINFSNQLALHNSHLLKCYSLCDRRVRQLVLFVKEWSKKRKINTPYHGTLSSYGYVLMVLHYLANIAQPPVVPNLQQVPLAIEDELSSKVVELDGHNVQFLRNEAAIEDLLTRKAITKNTETVGSLLHGFFHYYAQQGYNSPAGGFCWAQDVLSLRTVGGLLPKQAKGWTGAKTEHVELKGPGPQQTKDIRQRYLFAIEDPFETEHNIARTVVHNGIVAIRDEFRRAQKLIEHAGLIPGKGTEDLLGEAEDRENLQYRAFGPRPRLDVDKAKVGRSNGADGKATTVPPTPQK